MPWKYAIESIWSSPLLLRLSSIVSWFSYPPAWRVETNFEFVTGCSTMQLWEKLSEFFERGSWWLMLICGDYILLSIRLLCKSGPGISKWFNTNTISHPFPGVEEKFSVTCVFFCILNSCSTVGFYFPPPTPPPKKKKKKDKGKIVFFGRKQKKKKKVCRA